ncbi:Cytochrome c551 peroxidase precursor [Aquisphaera giovannonii]|uniref:Methylamine utilization protein MauG n=1 Tax=Aquisphaera giovannonii TaxID=406548 RepID=A0A5B9VZU7_9BACT|nr:cytochrome c peroxidase [Aquisphaera giovannonii]QEH33305.1 Cytochrome c551 peroxidase precursor [Aquisphaera giovannonii]
MERLRRLSGIVAPGLVLAGFLGLGAGRLLSPPSVAQEEPHKPPDEDPTSPADYLWQASRPELIKDEPLAVKAPIGLMPLTPKVVVPAGNPITKGKYELGRQLYFDPRISLDGRESCATCHNPDLGWSDGRKTSTGIKGQKGNRNAPTVFNTAYGKTMFWDGRAPSLEGQAQGPMINPIEMGAQKHQDIVERLRKVPGYKEQFAKVFGTDVTLDGMSKAIATFERVAALSGNSKYDKYNAGDNDALSESEKRGMVLFGLRLSTDDEFKPGVELQKAKCTLCHVGSNFSDEQFHNIGVGWDESRKKLADIGRWAPVPIGHKTEEDRGAFKTPTCRNIELTAPYMHDGSMKTLEEIVEHYDKGGNPNPALDPDMKPLKLTAQEKADLVAFMKALTGEHKTLAELLPTLPPNADGSTVDPTVALTTASGD